ncbi:MAG: nucleoside triphosphate pyrophosphohydrolase, partial [Patescibacteria group bacterium]|nr:nucleoside triphosphate pyrophosphohydrolase [Patescibacteria group bacterium]
IFKGGKKMNGEGYPGSAEYNKLVRDGIPRIIEESGSVPETKELTKEEKIGELVKKVEEERQELIQAIEKGDNEEIKKELSDIMEVVRSLGKEYGISLEEITVLMEERKKKRGGFDEGIFLIRTREKE